MTINKQEKINAEFSSLPSYFGQNFRIREMKEIYESNAQKPDKPHRHDFYTIVFILNAEGKHIIDFQTYDLSPNSVFFVSPGQVHQVVEKGPPVGFVITFGEAFLIQNHITNQFISDINLFRPYGESPPLSVNQETSQHLQFYCQQLIDILEHPSRFQSESIGAWLKLFLIACHQSCDLPPMEADRQMESGVMLLRSFRTAVESGFKSTHKVADYATNLSVSPDHLNKTIKTLTGQSAKEYIQNRLIIEAKRLLLHTPLSVKEIAWSLGFDDPSHFSRFFKKWAGSSITNFRSNINP